MSPFKTPFWLGVPLSGRQLISTLGVTTIMIGLAMVPVPAISYGAALVVLLLLPGMQVVRWVGLYSGWRDIRTLALSVAAGLLIVPIFLHWMGLLVGYGRGVAVGVPVGLTAILTLVCWMWPAETHPVEPTFEDRRQWLLFAVLLIVLAIGIVIPYIRVYAPEGVYPVEMGDWFKHYGVTWSIRHTGVPPVDVFFYGDPARERMSYYYYFHLTAASLDFIHGGPSSIYHALLILILAASLSFLTVFFLFARRFLGKVGGALWSTFCLAFVGGLDVFPMVRRNLELYQKLNPGKPVTWMSYVPADHVDNWAPAPYLRLNTLYATFIWVPQHVTGLLACIFGAYLYREVLDRRRLLTVAPFVLLSILGHSTWIAMVVYVCLAVFAVLQVVGFWRSGDRVSARWTLIRYGVVGLTLLIIGIPLLRELTNASAPKSGIVFEIPLTNSWRELSFFRTTFPNVYAARLLDLMEHYFIEVGPILLVGVMGWLLFRREKASEPLLLLLLLVTVAGFGVITFFASGRAWTHLDVTLNNDLGMRAIMPAQTILCLFSGYLVSRLSSWPSKLVCRRALALVVACLMAVGALAFGWEVCAMGVAKYLRPPRIDAATYRAFQAMPTVTEPMSVVKHRTHDNASSYQLMFGDRSPGFFTVEAAVFHPDLTQVAYQFGLSRFAYLNDLPAWSYQMFREMYADYVYVGAIDREKDLSPGKFDNPTYFRPVYQEGDISIYQVQDLPLGEVQAKFSPAGVGYLGYIVDEHPVYPIGFEKQSPKALVTAWKLNQPVDQDFTVYVHFLGPDGLVVTQADHLLWTWSNQAEGPTSTWEAGKMVLDIVPIPEEALTSEVPLRIGIGLWVPETGEYQQVDPMSLSLGEGQRLVIGTYP